MTTNEVATTTICFGTEKVVVSTIHTSTTTGGINPNGGMRAGFAFETRVSGGAIDGQTVRCFRAFGDPAVPFVAARTHASVVELVIQAQEAKCLSEDSKPDPAPEATR